MLCCQDLGAEKTLKNQHLRAGTRNVTTKIHERTLKKEKAHFLVLIRGFSWLLLGPGKQVADRADAAGFFHLFAGAGGRVLDAGETQAKFVGVGRAA